MILASLLLSAASASAQTGCVALVPARGEIRPAPFDCDASTPDRRLPVAQSGTRWVRRGAPGEFRSEIWLNQGPGGPTIHGLRPDMPLLLRAISVDAQGWHMQTPRADDYVYWTMGEAVLGRPEWAGVQAHLGLIAAPDDKRLQALAARLPALWRTDGPFNAYVTQETASTGHRMLEQGRAEAAVPWLSASLEAHSTLEARTMRAAALHCLGRDKEALADAEAGLALAPNDAMLSSLKEQLSRSSTVAIPAPAPTVVPLATQVPMTAKGGPIISPPEPEKTARPKIDAPPSPPPQPRGSLAPVVILLAVGITAGLAAGRMFKSGKPGSVKPAAGGQTTVRDTNTLPTLSRYVVRRQIGAGGMGIVYEAVEVGPESKVAIKQMRRELRENPADREKFLAEAAIVARLKHPHIVAFREVVEESGELFLIFDYVDGEPLSEVLRKKGRLGVEQTQLLFKQVCEAISCAHAAHVLHRDLKPSNIMVDSQGAARVMDFGIARQAKDTITRLTRADASGTPAYMAPEQHLGRFNKASDIYALGVCLYEALTGKLPFPGPDFLAQKERMHYPPPQIVVPSLPKISEILFQVTLAADPDKRVADAEELIDSLRRLSA